MWDKNVNSFVSFELLKRKIHFFVTKSYCSLLIFSLCLHDGTFEISVSLVLVSRPKDKVAKISFLRIKIVTIFVMVLFVFAFVF